MANLKHLFLVLASGIILLGAGSYAQAGADFTINNKSTSTYQVGFEKLNNMTGTMSLASKKNAQSLNSLGDKATLDPGTSYDVTCTKDASGAFARDLFLYQDGQYLGYWRVKLNGKKYEIDCMQDKDSIKGKLTPNSDATKSASSIVISK